MIYSFKERHNYYRHLSFFYFLMPPKTEPTEISVGLNIIILPYQKTGGGGGILYVIEHLSYHFGGDGVQEQLQAQLLALL